MLKFSVPSDRFGAVAERLGAREKYDETMAEYNTRRVLAEKGLATLSLMMGSSFPDVSEITSHSYMLKQNPAIDECATLYFSSSLAVRENNKPFELRSSGAEKMRTPITEIEQHAAKTLGVPFNAVTAVCFGYAAHKGNNSSFLKGELDGWQPINRTRISGKRRAIGAFPCFNESCLGSDYAPLKLPCNVGIMGLSLWGSKAEKLLCAGIEKAMETENIQPPPRSQIAAGNAPIEGRSLTYAR